MFWLSAIFLLPFEGSYNGRLARCLRASRPQDEIQTGRAARFTGYLSYEYREYYRRKLPHIHHPGTTLFVTFRLAGSIPQTVLQTWRSERDWLKAKENQAKDEETRISFHRRWFKRFEDVLHSSGEGPMWLGEETVAAMMQECLHFRDGKLYELHAFCIMSNHVHIVFMPLLDAQKLQPKITTQGLRLVSDDPDLQAIMQSIKSYSAHKANKLLQREGEFWESESYDDWVRDDEEFMRIVRYVLENPVKAGLVRNWREWSWSYVKEEDFPGE